MRARPLSMLQRGVIKRLRYVGQTALADLAANAWRNGREHLLSTEITDPELRADFDRANLHAVQE